MENSILFFSLEHVPYILVANQMTGHQDKSSRVGILDMTLSHIVMVLWKITLNEKKLILETHPFSTDP